MGWKLAGLCALLVACGGDDGGPEPRPVPALADQVSVVTTYDASGLNADLDPSLPTVDVAIYLTESGPLTWDELVPGIERAKRIYLEHGVQIRVPLAVQVRVPADWQTLDPGEAQTPTTVEHWEKNLDAHLGESQTRLTERTRDVFEAITWQFPEQERGVLADDAVHIISLEEVPIGYWEWDGATWSRETAPTGGLSFPPYIHADRIPSHLRGVITLSVNPNALNRATRVLSHELGHKLINVSHEGMEVCPAFEADGDDLMLYGDGERIASGETGRWHHERLSVSPFLYTLDQGLAVFDHRFEDGGVYTDGLYGDWVIDPPCP